MEIVSHRGYWKSSNEKNEIVSFKRSFSLGFGTETDIRDYKGELVISHDIPSGNELTVEDFFEIYKASNCTGTLALNIKSDGLQKKLLSKLNKYEINNYVVFDMSIPDTLGYISSGLKVLSRFSEYEPENPLWNKSDGIWLDSFEGHGINLDIMSKILNRGKKVFVVSPELHAREYLSLWAELKRYLCKCELSEKVVLCTDIPEEARLYFNG
ncbi:hypothetical protein [Vibrio fluvialis]|uniref:hypothetical protein n=1 Tax=Vibrio fluvialis TaxID=676 RepID=UPI001404EFA3|nr:hypothetical protein [Vibrio fluvialis]EKO3980407.1 hypothetical protein [Vibrio fluvialis]MBY8246273.1 hypothetical protein [Vibrio fluvialis]NHN74916.1 hypothetical protein [Vibrio fluvialis]